MDAYVAKPVRVEDLAGILRSLVVTGSEGPSRPAKADVTTADLQGGALEEIRALGLLPSITSEFRRGALDDIVEVKRRWPRATGRISLERHTASRAAA